MLNSATTAPLAAASGAYMAAGNFPKDNPTTKHISHVDIAASGIARKHCEIIEQNLTVFDNKIVILIH